MYFYMTKTTQCGAFLTAQSTNGLLYFVSVQITSLTYTTSKSELSNYLYHTFIYVLTDT